MLILNLMCWIGSFYAETGTLNSMHNCDEKLMDFWRRIYSKLLEAKYYFDSINSKSKY